MAYNPNLYMPYGQQSYPQGYSQPLAAPMTVQPNWAYQPTQATTGNLVSVTGIEGAKAYQMGPNSRMVLFDADSDTMYLKSTDSAGYPTLKVFDFVERKDDGPIDVKPVPAVTREEFDALAEQVRALANPAAPKAATRARKATDGE